MEISIKDIYKKNNILWNPLYSDEYYIDTCKDNEGYIGIAEGIPFCSGLISLKNLETIKQKLYCRRNSAPWTKKEYPYIIISIVNEKCSLVEKISGISDVSKCIQDVTEYTEYNRKKYRRNLAALNFYKKLAKE